MNLKYAHFTSSDQPNTLYNVWSIFVFVPSVDLFCFIVTGQQASPGASELLICLFCLAATTDHCEPPTLITGHG